MYFKNPQELVEFFNKLDLEKSTLVFKEGKQHVTVKEEKDCACKGAGTCQCGPKKEVSEQVNVDLSNATQVLVESFFDEESFDLKLSENEENVFYVSDFEAVQDACGTGKIVLPNRTLFMNMCEMENKAKVHLDIVIEDQKFNQVEFTLERTVEKPYLQISKNHLSS